MTETKEYRILEDAEEKLAFYTKRKELALKYIKQLELEIENIKKVWKKYGITDIHSSNIYFTNGSEFERGKSPENAMVVANLIITFDKQYTDLQMTRMLKLLNVTSIFLFPGMNRDRNTHKYVLSSDVVYFSINPKI